MEPPALRPVWAEIDTGAVTHNVQRLRAHAAGAELMAVVKADGYGHGAVPVARAALAGGATWLGVALVEEGAELRTAGIDAPILLLSEPPPAAAPAVLANRLTPTVYTHTFTHALIEAVDTITNPPQSAHVRDRGAVRPESVHVREGSGSVEVHLKLDTGMRRVGLAEEHWADAMRHLAANNRIRVTGIWSHLAVGDEPDNDFTRLQGERFERGVDLAEQVGLRPTLRHLCNSGGTTLYPELHHDIVRTGISIYGLDAAPGVRLDDLRPAMALRARLSLVKPVSPGDTLSYGRRWTAREPTIVGTVPAGYADGVRRRLTNVGQVTHDGRRVPIAGTVCMDQFMVDLGAGSTARDGDDVWLLGGPGPDAVTAEDWAAWLDTITYEITCGIGKRVPRVHA